MSRQLPLTFQQEWLWDVIQENQSWQCAGARAFRLSGLLNVSLLQKCLHEVGQRHDALRTQVATRDGGVWQEIRDQDKCILDCITLSDASNEQLAVSARRHFEGVCDRKINISAEPFWNARVLELNEHEHWLVLAMHRLIGDCATIEQIYREIKLLYDEQLEGRPSALKPAAQYGGYTVWQQQTSAEWVERHEPHWKRYLAEATSIQWPVDRDLTATAPGILGKAQCSFGRALSADLLALARAVRTLPAVPMLAIYAAVLWRWCQQRDFVLPLNTTGRPTAYKSAIGYFSYPLYLRIHMTGDETFRDLVSHVGNEFFSSMSHQDFGRLARQRPELLTGTLFQWLTSYPEEAPKELVRVREFGEGMTLVPPGMTSLEVTVFDTATDLHAFGSYRADRFTAKSMQRFMADLRWVAELFIHDPDTRIAAVAEVGGDVDGTAERDTLGVARSA